MADRLVEMGIDIGGYLGHFVFPGHFFFSPRNRDDSVFWRVIPYAIYWYSDCPGLIYYLSYARSTEIQIRMTGVAGG